MEFETVIWGGLLDVGVWIWTLCDYMLVSQQPMGMLPSASAESGFYSDSALICKFNFKPRTRPMDFVEVARQ